MMKKISKLALLAAATAFLLAAFPACSDDDDDNTTVQPGGGDTGDGNGGSEDSNAKSFTIDFAELTATDIAGLGITATEKGKDTGKIKATDEAYTTSLDATLYSKKDGNLQVRFTDKDSIDSPKGINYNGGDFGDISGSKLADNTDLDRYVGVSVGGAGTLKASYKSTHKISDLKGQNDESLENHCQIAFITKDGTVLKCQPVTVGESGVEDTLECTVSEAGNIVIVFSRNGTQKWDSKNSKLTGTGGIDLSSIEFTVAQ